MAVVFFDRSVRIFRRLGWKSGALALALHASGINKAG